jgi:hypothetical protein
MLLVNRLSSRIANIHPGPPRANNYSPTNWLIPGSKQENNNLLQVLKSESATIKLRSEVLMTLLQRSLQVIPFYPSLLAGWIYTAVPVRT